MFFKRCNKSKGDELGEVYRRDFVRETREELEKLLQKKDLFQFDTTTESEDGSGRETGNRSKKALRRSLSLPSNRCVRSTAQIPQTFTPRPKESKNDSCKNESKNKEKDTVSLQLSQTVSNSVDLNEKTSEFGFKQEISSKLDNYYTSEPKNSSISLNDVENSKNNSVPKCTGNAIVSNTTQSRNKLTKQIGSTNLTQDIRTSGASKNFVVVARSLNIEKEKIMNQMDSYITWVNAQLIKRPNSRHVKDLSKDMSDGVVFLQLVEVISTTKQAIIDNMEMSINEMRQNLNTVIQFLSNNNIRVHHILPKEIIEGNLKTIMRLVLALAAHFKPDSFNYHSVNSKTPVKNSINRSKLAQRTPSIVSLASEAAASLAEASKNASKGGSSSLTHKYRNQQRFDSTPPKSSKSVYSQKVSKSFTMPHRSDSTPPNRLPVTKTRPLSLRLDSAEIPDLSHVFQAKKLGKLSVTEFPADGSEIKTKTENMTSTPAPPNLQSVKRSILTELEGNGEEKHSELIGLHDDLMEELTDAKDVLEQLQNVLLNGKSTDDLLGIDAPRDESFQEQLVVKNIMLENIENECTDLRHQMNEFKEINMRKTSEKHGLELRLSQQEQLILSLKSKLLEYEHPKNPGTSEKELNALLMERNRELQLLYQELAKRDELIEKQKTELDKMSHDIVGKKRSEANLYAKLESSESMVSSLQMQLREAAENMHLQSAVRQNHVDDTSMKIQEAKLQKFKQKIAREHQNLSITLNNIRASTSKDDPVQHALQSMDHSLTSLMDSFSLLDTTSTKSSSTRHQPSNGGGSPRKTSRETQRISLPKQSHHRNSKTKSSVSSDSGYDHNANAPLLDTPEQVKVVYFLGKSVTPILKTSDIGLGYLTLRDFKVLVNRPGKYRYYFKSKDKDFGFVREELLFDDDVVPGYDNKIVSWIERSVGEEV